MVGNGTIYLYWGQCGRVCRCGSLLGTLWKGIGRFIPTEDGVVNYVAEELYWGRCARLWRCRSLLETVW